MVYYCFINGAVVADPESFVKTAEEAETTSFFAVRVHKHLKDFF